MYTCSNRSFKILASFCSWAGWFESYLIKNPWRHVFLWCGLFSFTTLQNYLTRLVLSQSRRCDESGSSRLQDELGFLTLSQTGVWLPTVFFNKNWSHSTQGSHSCNRKGHHQRPISEFPTQSVCNASFPLCFHPNLYPPSLSTVPAPNFKYLPHSAQGSRSYNRKDTARDRSPHSWQGQPAPVLPPWVFCVPHCVLWLEVVFLEKK